jgi:uncharacterized protein (TIGR01244 family)
MMVADPEDIHNWQRLSPRVTTSGRLRPEDLPRLAALGVRHVVNLALDGQPGALPNEGALLSAAGIGYTHIPIPFDAPEERHFTAFRAAIEAGEDAPLHVHCMVNWRVSALFYRYNRDHGGMPEAEARALMERQWSPETSEHKDAETWARLIAPR